MKTVQDTEADVDFENRKEVFEDVVEAFAVSYDFIGAQVARETLMSAATWNIEKNSDPPLRYRTHVMLTWEPGWLKSTILRRMADLLGDDLTATVGKMTAAVLRGSVNNGKFSPPAVLKAPIIISTEFGQTQWQEQLLHTFLNLLEEGQTNVSLNKIAGMSEASKANVKKKYGESITFGEENEFDLHTDVVFWGATHDPSLLDENALKGRFNIVTPAQPLDGQVVESIDKSASVKSLLETETVKEVRRLLKSDKPVIETFDIPSPLYKQYNFTPRLSRDVKSYMAARHWWGLETNPDIMEQYTSHLIEARRKASMSDWERVQDLVFDSPKTYDEIQRETALDKVSIYNILNSMDAERLQCSGGEVKWVVQSGDGSFSKAEKQKERALENLR